MSAPPSPTRSPSGVPAPLGSGQPHSPGWAPRGAGVPDAEPERSLCRKKSRGFWERWDTSTAASCGHSPGQHVSPAPTPTPTPAPTLTAAFSMDSLRRKRSRAASSCSRCCCSWRRRRGSVQRPAWRPLPGPWSPAPAPALPGGLQPTLPRGLLPHSPIAPSPGGAPRPHAVPAPCCGRNRVRAMQGQARGPGWGPVPRLTAAPQ